MSASLGSPEQNFDDKLRTAGKIFKGKGRARPKSESIWATSIINSGGWEVLHCRVASSLAFAGKKMTFGFVWIHDTHDGWRKWRRVKLHAVDVGRSITCIEPCTQLEGVKVFAYPTLQGLNSLRAAEFADGRSMPSSECGSYDME